MFELYFNLNLTRATTSFVVTFSKFHFMGGLILYTYAYIFYKWPKSIDSNRRLLSIDMDHHRYACKSFVVANNALLFQLIISLAWGTQDGSTLDTGSSLDAFWNTSKSH